VFNWNRNDTGQFDGQGGSAGYGWDSPSTWAGSATGVRDGYLTAAFNWMFLALLVSAATAFVTLTNPDAFELVCRRS
jgi:hypothetical protein